MKTLGKAKVILSSTGITISLITLLAASNNNNSAQYWTDKGDTERAEQCRSCYYAGLATAIVLGGASIGILLDKGTYGE